jgi:transmembrane sensor
VCLPVLREALVKNEIMTQELLIKFLNDQCTDEELQEVIQWVKKDALTNGGRNWGLQDWNTFQGSEDFLEKEQFGSMLNKIHQKIIQTQNQQPVNRPAVSIISWITKAAAILLLPVLGILFYLLIDQKAEFSQSAGLLSDSLQVVTPVGSRTVMQLPDGTQVYLNNGSQLKYPQKFTGKSRGVVLTGEGYFEVAHNPDKPFCVHAGKLTIKAVGTKFNVMAYPEEKMIATTLVEGKVIVEQKTDGKEGKPICDMIPGQHMSYNITTSNITSTRGDIEEYIAWKEGKFIFKNESIVHVAERLSRMYNVDIEIADDIRDYTYTVTFIDEPLFQILDLMQIATPVKYKAVPRKKLPDGTFSKQKILINKRN